MPGRITGKLRERRQFTRRDPAEERADQTFLG
jgi:hypothetical protein